MHPYAILTDDEHRFGNIRYGALLAMNQITVRSAGGSSSVSLQKNVRGGMGPIPSIGASAGAAFSGRWDSGRRMFGAISSNCVADSYDRLRKADPP